MLGDISDRSWCYTKDRNHRDVRVVILRTRTSTATSRVTMSDTRFVLLIHLHALLSFSCLIRWNHEQEYRKYTKLLCCWCFLWNVYTRVFKGHSVLSRVADMSP